MCELLRERAAQLPGVMEIQTKISTLLAMLLFTGFSTYGQQMIRDKKLLQNPIYYSFDYQHGEFTNQQSAWKLTNKKLIPFEGGQVWKGSYTCGQRTTALDLRIQRVSQNKFKTEFGDAYDILATFNFDYKDGKEVGSFYLNGKYYPEMKTAVFNPSNWIKKPRGYSTVGLEGTISEAGIIFSGQITHTSACKGFHLTLISELEYEPELSISNSNPGSERQIIPVVDSTLWGSVEYSGSLGLKSTGWLTTTRGGEDLDGPVTMHNESLNSYKVYIDISVFDRAFMLLDIEQPTTPTRKQSDMLSATNSQNYGIEKYTFGINIGPLISQLGLKNSWITNILSIEFYNTYEMYYSEMKALKNFYYVNGEKPFSPDLIRNGSYQYMHAGDSLGYKLTINDFWLLIPLFDYSTVITDVKSNRKTLHPKILYFGYFKTNWKRPSDHTVVKYTEGDVTTDILFGWEYMFQGLCLGFKEKYVYTPGLNYDFIAKANYIIPMSSYARSAFSEIKEPLDFIEMVFNSWYNWNIKSNSGKFQGAFKIGVNYQRRRIILTDEKTVLDQDQKLEFWTSLTFNGR